MFRHALFRPLLSAATLFTAAGLSHAATLKGYWEFASAASGGAFSGVTLGGAAAPNLVIEGTAPAYNATLADDATPTPVTTLNGTITTVQGAANRLKLTHGIAPSGGATYVNKYTLMFDVFSPSASRAKWRCFYQANSANTDDGDFFIKNASTAETIGIADITYSSSTLSPGKWHRVVISVDAGNSIVSYVDGALFKTHTASSVDGHLALRPSILLFGDNDGENYPLNIGAVAIWDGAMTATEAATLGLPGTAVSTTPPPNNAPVIAQGATTSLDAVKDGAAVTTTLNGSDANGDAITWSVTTPPTHGTAQVTSSNATCPLSYTPAAGYTGTDSFVVRVTDGTDSTFTTVYVVVSESSTVPRLTGLWEFNNSVNRNQATIGFDLEPTGTGFTTVAGIDGADGAVEVAKGSYYKVTHGVQPNGSASAKRANQYSLVWDIKIPTASAAIYKNLLQTTVANNDDGDLFINTTNNIGGSAPYGGYSASAVSTNAWHRVVLTVNNGSGRNIWVDGVKVLSGSAGTLDETRFGLLGQILAFADDDGEDGAIDVSSMASFNGVLSDNQITLLGNAGTPMDVAMPPKPAPYALWQFDEPTRPEAPTVGNNRLVRNGAGFSSVAGRAAGDGAIEIAAGSNYLVPHGIAANGGGSKVNEYSVLWDVKYPNAGTTKSLYQTTLANTDDAELTVDTTGKVGHTGLGGFSSQSTAASNWYRVVMVVKNGTDRSIYVNGTLWYDGNAGVVDDSYALDPAGFLAFADDNGGDDVMDVTTLAVWGRALTVGEVLVLGDSSVAAADGVTPVAPNSAPVITEGETYTLNATKNGGAVSATVHASDADNEALSWSVSSAATSGTVDITGANTSAGVTYTPANGFSGLDSFVVRVSDGWSSDTITFNVTVTNPFADPVLTVVSAHGTPTPEAGTYPHARGTALSNSVADEATATSRYHCIGWSMVGDGPHSGTTASMSMTLTRDSTLTWLWQTEYRVELATSGNGTISASSGWFEANRPIQITATPATGYYFAGWSGDTSGCTMGGKSIVVPVDRAYATITANFATVENFTVVGLPDTQNYCTTANSPLGIYDKQTQWVVDNKETLNIKFLTHLGDIVDSATNTGQWTIATAAMGKLDTKLPYGVCTGNHDLANGSTHYLDRFGPTHSRWVDPATSQVYDWYQGASPRGYSSYQVITVNGRDYMFLHIDCDCPDSDMAWAATVLSQHPRTVTFLTTHDYLAETGASSSSGSGTGQRGRVNWSTGYISVGPDRNTVTDIWNTLVKPFNQVYMVICGHNFAQYNVDDTNAAGKTVHQVIADYQTLPNGGNGFLRIMEFRPAQNQIYNTTYSPHLGRYMSNTSSPSAQLTSDNTGMLDLTDKNGGEFMLITDFDTRFNHNLTIVSAQPTVSPAVGTASIEEGTPVVASATDNVVGTTRYKCTGWTLTGGQTGAGSGKTASFTMAGDATLTWNWTTEYYLDTQATGRGIVSVNSGYQAAGANVTILAQPDGGAAFLRWSGDIAGCTIDGSSITVPMTRGRGPVTAEFTPLVPTYNVVVVSDYPGVTPTPASYPFEQGTVASFSAQDYTDGGVRHVCTGWSTSGGVVQSGSGNSAEITVTGDFTFTWQWKAQYLLQTDVNGPGTVTGNGSWVDGGTSVQVTATAGPGAAFTSWSGDTVAGTATGNVFTISSMSRAVGPLVANFATGYHTLTVVSDQANTLPVPGSYSFPHGSQVSFSAQPVENGRTRFVPTGWTLGNGSSGDTTEGSFTITADTTLTWSWSPQVVLEVAGGSEGSILPTNAGGWHTLGTTVTLHAQPATDFGFAAWRGDVTGTPSSQDITLTLDQPRTIAADFKASAAPGGTPRWWLDRHGKVVGGDYSAAELADADGDGKTAAEEFIAGMDDLDPSKTFGVKGIQRATANTLTLNWPGAAGRTYGIWSSPDLQTPFTLVRDGIPAVEPLTTADVTIPGAARFFYKVKADLAPGTALDLDPLATSPEPKPGSLVREMKFIPAGTFTMGDDNGGEQSAMPAHPVQVSAFYMDKFEVTLGDWQTVVNWAQAHGYDIPLNLTFSPPLNHPAPAVTWYDAVKWCNARSEMEGRVPAYYTDATTTNVYRSGTVDLVSANVNWAGNGYRLPTEAEWERASRGGLEGKIYSWGDESLVGRTNGWQYQQAIDNVESPYPLSTPVGYFDGHQEVPGPDMANGFGLYDMSGNVWEWCWDRYSDYEKPKLFDPKGPDVGETRLTRGGSWWNNEADMTNAHRYPFPPVGETIYGQIGFRTIRAAAPNEIPH
ncbi:MAG: SUMF1/EgtB/PvdO family nonheme iron enzyme [Luteolibacter sp.]